MSGYFYITCKKNGKVLDCKGNDKPVALTTLTIRERVEKTDGKQGRNEHRDTQLWKWDSEGRLVNKADNNLVADVKEKKKEAGTPVILWAPHLKPNQKWRVSDDIIHSELNDLVMDASDLNVKMSVKKKDPEERDMAHQTWEFIPEEIQYFYIISEKDGKVLDSAIDVEGQILTTSPRTGEDTQLWRFDGNCLVNKLGFVADVKENNEAAATPVILSSQTGDLNQHWKLDNGQIRSMLNDLVMEIRCNAVEMHHSLKSPRQKWKVIQDKGLKPITQYFYIVSQQDGKVLDSKRVDLEQELTVSPKSGRDTQLWSWDSSGSKLVNKVGLVASVKKEGKEAKTSVIQSLPTGTSNQRWQQEGGYIRSELNFLVLGVWNSQIIMETPCDKNTQKWKIVADEDLSKYFYVLNGEDGKALDSTTDEKGNLLITSEFLRHSSQMWKWDSEGRLVSKSGLVADINHPNVEAGAQMVLSSSTDASSQKWEEDNEYIKSKQYPLVIGACKSELTTELDFDEFTTELDLDELTKELNLDTEDSNSEVVVQPPAGRLSQKWKLLNVEDHHTSPSPYFFIVNGQDGKVLDAAVNEPDEQLITFTALRRGTQLWRWDSEGRLVNKAGLVAGIKQKDKIKSFITQAQYDVFQLIQKSGDPVLLSSLNSDPNKAWRVEERVIKCGMNDLAMDASGSRLTISSVSDSLAQKWEFVPEDLWDDYKLMLEDENPLSVAAFWKEVAQFYMNGIIGCGIEEYQEHIPHVIAEINDCADQLAKKSSKAESGLPEDGAGNILGDVAFIALSAAKGKVLSVGRRAAVATGQVKTFSSGIVEQTWDKQKIQAVKDLVGPLFRATICLQGFLSRYIEKLKAVSEYLGTKEGKEMAIDSYSLYEKVEGGSVAWNEDQLGSSFVTSTRHVAQAKQMKELVEYVQSDFYTPSGFSDSSIFGARTLAAAGTTSAKVLTGSLAVFGIAFGIWDTVIDINDINERSKLAEKFRETAQQLKEESDKLIELYNELFVKAELTYDLKSSTETT